MKNRTKGVGVLVLLIVAVFVLNYTILDNSLVNFLDNSEEIHVDRVIDGDTIESNKTSIRFLGINTPEHNEFFYQEAKDFLTEKILNKTVRLEFVGDRQDKYYRTLAYVFLGNENVNVAMVSNGFANYYFYSGRDKYSNDLETAWKTCLNNNVNLCEPSNNACSKCITINQTVIVNTCSFSCNVANWTIKGEGREKFAFNGTLNPREQTKFTLDLANSGGGLFLRDERGKLVEWKA